MTNSQLFTRTTVHPHEMSLQHPISDFARLLAKWVWTPSVSDYQWLSAFPTDHQLHSYANISECNWKAAIDFLCSLQWIVGENYETAYIELAFAFWSSGNRFQGIDVTPAFEV